MNRTPSAVSPQPAAEMRLIRQPNRWSCNACAFAMVLGITLEEIVEALGHDGQANGGFTDEELIWFAAQRGAAVTDVQPWRPEDLAVAGLAQDGRPSPWDVVRFMFGKRGVATVTHPEIPEGLHAVAWDGARAFDPLRGVQFIHDDYRLHSFCWIERIPSRRAA